MSKYTVEFHKNMAVEFILSIVRFALKEKMESYSFKLNEEILEWEKEVDQDILPFFRNDLSIIKKTENLLWPILDLILIKEINEPEKVLKLFKDIESKEFVIDFLNSFILEDKIDDLNNNSRIEKILSNSIEDQDIVKYIINLTQSPDELKERVYLILKQFYNNYFKGREEVAESYLTNKINEHRKLYDRDPDLFFEYMTGFKQDNIDQHCSKISLIITYHGEVFSYYKPVKNKKINIIYGISLEQKFDEELRTEQSKLLFKVLSDEKRLMILKMLANKPRYAQELADYFGITTATMSYHISKLFELGVITFNEREKNRIYYQLETESLKRLFTEALQYILEEKD